MFGFTQSLTTALSDRPAVTHQKPGFRADTVSDASVPASNQDGVVQVCSLPSVPGNMQTSMHADTDHVSSVGCFVLWFEVKSACYNRGNTTARLFHR